MAIQFTEQQNKVLQARGHNVLVSAAAGSGKTAVLVERIIRLITEPVKGPDRTEHTPDIDRLLVVTFTRAAAAQMRERIGAAISKRLEEDPGNRHLQRQETLLHHAQITTIDSFCTFLLRNHFSEIGLDPSFRQMDETESQLLLKDTLGAFLEQKYAEGNPVFLSCVNYFCTGTDDTDLEGLVQKLYRAADSHIDPAAWLESCRKAYEIGDAEDYFASQPLQQVLLDGLMQLQQVAALYDRMTALCEKSGGPGGYLDFLEEERKGLLSAYGILDPDARLAEDLEACRQGKTEGCKERWNRLVDAVHYSFGRIPTLRGKRAEEVDSEQKAQVQALRDQAKELVGELREGIFAQNAETAATAMQRAGIPLKELLHLTEEFIGAFAAAKKQRNAIDFSDLERFSLHVLLTRDADGKLVPGKAAESLQAFFEEILIDEYQDSNEVQELLLSVIAGEGWASRPKPRFMVGDVKQSIYRFRNARPSIFVEKYETYRPDDSAFERIDLDQNFRSRREVLDSVNAVFMKIMRREIGGVEYSGAVALKPGAAYPAGRLPWQYRTEMIAVTKEEAEAGGDAGTEEEPDDEIAQLTSHEKEALAIAQKIQALRREQFPVKDDETGEMVPLRYRDIVILVRSAASYNEAFRTIFEREGIPLYVDSRTGYFAAEEVREIMQLLRVLDNPLQDIPLYGVLRGYFGGFGQEEIAQIRAYDLKDALLYDALCSCAGVGPDGLETEGEADPEDAANAAGGPAKGSAKTKADPVLRERCRSFLEQLRAWRRKTATTPVSELLSALIYDTGYMNHILAMPSGEQRQANVRELLVKAQDFEKTEYTGLFRFLRYIDQMHQFSVDYGEASVLDENADVVRLMTIHKSKGLEFPVCFVAGLGSRLSFRGKDTAGLLITDPDLGCGIDYVDLDLRVRIPTLQRKMVANRIREESLGEELRVLYVAMTRAKEKLFLVGSVRNLEKKKKAIEALLAVSGEEDHGHLPAAAIRKAGSFLDLILMSLPAAEDAARSQASAGGNVMDVETMPVSDLQLAQALGQASMGERMTKLSDLAEGRVTFRDQDIETSLARKFSYVYPHQDLAGLFTKTTVSELKRASIEEDLSPESSGEGADWLYTLSDAERVIPDFAQENTAEEGKTERRYVLKGAARGTAIHRGCELIDYRRWPDPSAVTGEMFRSWVNSLLAAGEIPASYGAVLTARNFLPFLHSSLARRMAAADALQQLRREQPFVYGVQASRIRASFPDSEMVLVQGIIDAFFIEDGRITVVDYKTDHVRTTEELKERYQIQLDYYAEALKGMLGLPVAEKCIYSFALQEEIRL